MSFGDDLCEIEGCEDAWERGLQALSAADRAHLSVANPRRLAGSANVDAALRSRFPNAARWDYAIVLQLQSGEKAYWVEVHPATGSANIRDLENKLRWLMDWLRDEAAKLGTYPREIVWVATSHSTYRRGSPQLRRLESQGLRYAGAHLQIPDSE